jgi:hypothetical protein
LLLSSLTPPNCHLSVGKTDAQIFAGLGLGTKEGRKRLANRKYNLKVERETNYSKFYSRCRALELECPDNDIWVNDLKKVAGVRDFGSPQPKESKRKAAERVIDFGSISPDRKKMPSTRSTSHVPNYDEPGKFIRIVNSTILKITSID